MRSQTNFKALQTTKKGTAGETIVKAIFEGQGWVMYEPATDSAHLVDFIGFHPDKGLLSIETKSYPRRACCNDTGIDKPDFDKYRELWTDHNMRTCLIFCDPFEQMIYGAYLDAIEQTAHMEGSKVYFPLSVLKPIRRMNPAEVAAIGAVSDRYQDVKPFFAGCK